MKVHGGILHRITVLAVVVLGVGFGVGVTHADVKTVNVSCNNGQSIGKALEQGDERKPLVVVVQGICSENVVIDRDDVTLRGDGGGAGVTGLDPTKKDTILVDRARRVVIENLTVSGGRHGIMIEGGSATVINSTISGNTQVGIILVNGGNGRIGITNSDQYAGNTISNNGSDGIHLGYGATAFIGGNFITGNGTNDAFLFDRAGIDLVSATASVIGKNEITNNKGAGILARSSGLRIGDGRLGLATDNLISGNGLIFRDGGVFAYVGTGLDIRNATIIGNRGTGVTGVGSSLRIRDSAISGNSGDGVQAVLGTTLDFRNTTVSENTGGGGALGVGVLLTSRSMARMRGNTIEKNTSDGIRVVFGSGLFIDFVPTEPNTVTGNTGFGVNCTDAESSIINANPPALVLTPPDNLGGGVSGICTGF